MRTNWLDLNDDAVKLAKGYVEEIGREAVATRIELKGYDVVVRFRATDGRESFALGLHVDPVSFDLDVATELEADFAWTPATSRVIR